jgi:hypothetical protein
VRLAVVVFAMFALGCAGKHHPAPKPTVIVTQLSLDFPERERGALAFSLALPPGSPQASEVSWELFLDGSRFAAGLERVLSQEPGAIEVRSTLVVRHLGWREGEGTLDVALQGEVDFGDGRERQRFRDRREVVVQGRPQLNIPRD